MKSPMPMIEGNADLRRRLCDDILNGTAAHAYILAGPRGSGKHRIAMHYIAAVACENRDDPSEPLPCLRCPSCRKILEGNSPDVITVKKDGLSVKIDQVRTLLSDVRMVPNDLEDKFYIIEDAHTMTEEAQNAFLLTLEEPPSFVHFFLLCESTEPLLETIRSRAPVLRTEPIPHDVIRQYLMRESADAARLAHADPTALSDILAIADGAIGRALELINEKEREPHVVRRSTAESLIDLALHNKTVPLIELVNSLPTKQDELLPILSTAMTVLRDLIALKQSEDAPLCFFTDRDTATEKAYASSLSAMLSLYDILTQTADNLQRNANIKLTLTAMIAKI